MKALFFIAFAAYAVSVILEFTGTAFRKEKLLRAAWIAFIAAFALHTVFIVARGVAAKRLPLSNQFEFANGFAWGVALFTIAVCSRMKTEWLKVAAIPVTLLIMTYAALQPMEIRDLMPALRSAWFALHIGSAAFSYAAFAIAGGLGVGYLIRSKRGCAEDDARMRQIDSQGYRMVCLGFLLLTVVIFSGAIWAEQAWSSWWSWDPKETWALITWIFYAIYLHQRLRMKWRGKRMAWMAIIAVLLVIFTFAGVNLLLPGLHSYAMNN